jgi:hypothetical protein
MSSAENKLENIMMRGPMEMGSMFDSHRTLNDR